MGSNLGRDPKITRHVDDLYAELDPLFEAAEQVQAVLDHPGWAHVMRLLDAEVATTEADADGRLLESRSHYAFAHGRIGGLKGAREAARAILEKAERRMAQQRARHERGAEPSLEAR